MRRGAFLVLGLGACSYHGYDLDIDAGPSGGDDAAMIDAAQDLTCADQWHYQPSNFEPCPLGGTVLEPLTLSPGTYVFAPATGALTKDGSAFMTLATTGTSPRVLAIDGLTVDNGAILHVAGDGR